MFDLEQAGRYGPLLLITLAAVWAASRAYFLKRRSGITVLIAGFARKSAVETGLALLGVSLDFYLILRAFFPAIDTKLAPLSYGFPSLGLVLMGAGLTIMGVAQAQMRGAWRVGIPPAKEVSQMVIETGLFRYSRNPIYVAVFIFIVGACALVPNFFTLACLFAYGPLISAQVRREEAFMAMQFGEAYTAYTERVRRWI